MPFYAISHKDNLTPQQRDNLVAAITKTHTILFAMPSLFVNVKFEDSSVASYYVGGKPASGNTIHANVRTVASRPRSAYDELCRKLRAAWEQILSPPPAPLAAGSVDKTSAVDGPLLHAIFVHGSLVAGEEQDFLRPEVGKDEEWVRTHMAEFERRAAAEERRGWRYYEDAGEGVQGPGVWGYRWKSSETLGS